VILVNTNTNEESVRDVCDVPANPLPPSELGRYSIDRDPHSEQDIARYVENEAPDEDVQHVEKIKQEAVCGIVYEVWDVTTDKNRWWVITNLTNLYSQKHFPSLDYTLSFHIGLMMRIQSRPNGAHADQPSPFDEVFRRQEQAHNRLDLAVEAEDFQAVGMQLRECLLSLAAVLRRRIELDVKTERPQDANFIEWSAIIIGVLCAGSSNQRLRGYLIQIAKETWQLVNWLTHARNANQTACSIAVHACDTVAGHLAQLQMRERTDNTEECPLCKSRNIRSHYDRSIQPDGDYYRTCGICEWNSHPSGGATQTPP
jgi:hypothetical protein